MSMVRLDVLHCTLNHAQHVAHVFVPHVACHIMQVQIWML